MSLFHLAHRPAIIAALALILAACGGATSDQPAANGDTAPDTDAQNAATGALADMIAGDTGAPVTVIEYASVTCPACAAFHEKVYPDIKRDYIDTGKVRFIFREFPTPPALSGRCWRAARPTRAAKTPIFWCWGRFLKPRQPGSTPTIRAAS